MEETKMATYNFDTTITSDDIEVNIIYEIYNHDLVAMQIDDDTYNLHELPDREQDQLYNEAMEHYKEGEI